MVGLLNRNLIFTSFFVFSINLITMKVNAEFIDTAEREYSSDDVAGSNDVTASISDKMNVKTNMSLASGCNLTVSNRSISKFRHTVYYFAYNFVYLQLTPLKDITINKSLNIVGETIWTWTYYGKDGGLEYLKWPEEFGIWSMGFLSSTVNYDMPVELVRQSGNCKNLTVGNKQDDLSIANALVSLIMDLMNISGGDKYGPSFWCYKRRRYISSDFLYVLCKHVVCPAQFIEYYCCSYFFDKKILARKISCGDGYTNIFSDDEVWRLVPIIVAIIVFAYSPLLLMSLAIRFETVEHQPYTNTENSATPLHDILQETDNDIVLDEDETHSVTLFNTIFYPFIKVIDNYKSNFSRLLRLLFPFFSLSFIALQIILDMSYLRLYVMECIQHEIPIGFRSILAGYKRSKNNFLPFFGGPYVAIALYLFLACCAMSFPASLSHFLANGLPNTEDFRPKVLFSLGLRHIETYGNVKISDINGYLKIYNTLLGQFFMFLNVKFWHFAFEVQKSRWKSSCVQKRNLVLIPIYIIICVVEELLCLFLNGIPLFALGLTIIRAYCRPLVNLRNPSSMCSLCLTFAKSIFVSFAFCCVLFLLFMFCTIFLDACLFLARMLMFTYTGLVVYPKVAYGYFIFFITVVFYFWHCLNDFASHYDRILKITIKVADKIQCRNDSFHLVFVSKEGKKCIKTTLFNYVIERCSPRRKLAFLSILKLTLLLSIIGISLYLLTKMDKIGEIHIFMHVITALFTCALPQLIKSIFLRKQARERKQFKKEIFAVVQDYQGSLYVNRDSEYS